MLSEEDTRAKLVDPKLAEAGWTEGMIKREQRITQGEIINETGDRLPSLRVDYVLYYPDLANGIPIAVVEAEKEEKSHLEGLGQAKNYINRLAVQFAYSTNGHKIEEYDNYLLAPWVPTLFLL